MGRFVPGTFCSLGRFVLGRFVCAPHIVSRGASNSLQMHTILKKSKIDTPYCVRTTIVTVCSPADPAGAAGRAGCPGGYSRP